ncbi:MAG TPA: hypothetical protein VNN22_11330, partial [Verrucomicrobiae bacterium]|nr:hypothetical protein [Verrucomicrobiae bacterium]
GYARSLVQISPHIAAAARIINVVAEYVSHLRSYCRCSVKMVTRVTLTVQHQFAFFIRRHHAAPRFGIQPKNAGGVPHRESGED